jgi:hypothetical protein
MCTMYYSFYFCTILFIFADGKCQTSASEGDGRSYTTAKGTGTNAWYMYKQINNSQEMLLKLDEINLRDCLKPTFFKV